MKEFIKELKHNQNINIKKGLENRINIDYVIERLEDIEAEEKRKIQQAIRYIEIAFHDSEVNENEPITRKDLEYIYDMLTKKEG